MPLVSVIIPTRNRSALLQQALASVRHQTLTDWECVVVDDGSTDDTPDVALALGRVDGRLRYVRQDSQGGISRARNSGIQAARAPFIAFLDDDDRWYPEKLALQLAVFDANPEVGLVCARIRKHGLKEQIWPAGAVPLRPTFLDLVRSNVVPTSTVVVRRSAVDEAGGFDDRYTVGEDYDLWLRVARVTGVYALPLVLCDYLVHDGSINIQRLDTELRDLEVIYDRLQRECGVPRSVLAGARRRLCLRRVGRIGGPLAALGHLWKALTA